MDTAKAASELEASSEAYLEEHGIGALMEGLLKDLIVAKPADPLAWLTKALQGASSRMGVCTSWR